MNTTQDIRDFLSQKTLAIAGLSRSERAFSASVNRQLKAKGYRLLPVNPHAETIAGEQCYPRVTALPEKVGGVLVLTPPVESEKIVRDAATRGITRVWLQQGAESPAATAFCLEKGMQVVSGKCILMFAEPIGALHGIHRWFAKIFGKIP